MLGIEPGAAVSGSNNTTIVLCCPRVLFVTFSRSMRKQEWKRVEGLLSNKFCSAELSWEINLSHSLSLTHTLTFCFSKRTKINYSFELEIFAREIFQFFAATSINNKKINWKLTMAEWLNDSVCHISDPKIGTWEASKSGSNVGFGGIPDEKPNKVPHLCQKWQNSLNNWKVIPRPHGDIFLCFLPRGPWVS